MKKVKKQIPAYIPEHDALILARVRKSAYRLDMCLFNLFGIRFGWEAVIGIVPGAGDAIGVCLALLLVKECLKVEGGLDNTLKTRMMINIVLDFVVGLVPFIGDLADAAFKCNTKNLRLLEIHLDKKYRPQQGGPDERDLAGLDKAKRRQNRKSGIYHPQDPPPATVFEDLDEETDERVSQQNVGVQQPTSATAAEDKRGGNNGSGRGGWFSGAKTSKQDTRRDVEMSQPAGYGGQETGSVRQ